MQGAERCLPRLPAMQRIVCAVLAACLLGAFPAAGWAAGPASAEPSRPALARLDGYVQGLTASERFSGVVLVARQGRVLLHRAYGPLDEKADTPLTVDARFNIASAGKMFTAVAVLQQVAARRLTLDTHVGEVLKDYPEPTVARRVTVRQLLTHTAGAGDLDIFGADRAAVRERLTSVQDLLALHAARPPVHEPGREQHYGNFGHVILGRMVELLSGQSFDDYLAQHVLAPAGMRRTGSVACTAPDADLARSYATVDGERVSNCRTQPLRGFPAGGQMATAADLLRFVNALQSGRLLPPALFREATRTHRAFMGLGFFATGYGPGVPRSDFRWGHGGSADGVCADVRSYPVSGETIIVLSNRDAPACHDVANFAHAQLDPRPR